MNIYGVFSLISKDILITRSRIVLGYQASVLIYRELDIASVLFHGLIGKSAIFGYGLIQSVPAGSQSGKGS